MALKGEVATQGDSQGFWMCHGSFYSQSRFFNYVWGQLANLYCKRRHISLYCNYISTAPRLQYSVRRTTKNCKPSIWRRSTKYSASDGIITLPKDTFRRYRTDWPASHHSRPTQCPIWSHLPPAPEAPADVTDFLPMSASTRRLRPSWPFDLESLQLFSASLSE